MNKAMSSILKSTNLKEAKDLRILQRNLVYLLGIPECLKNPKLLSSSAYFGQFGKIQSIYVKRDKSIKR